MSFEGEVVLAKEDGCLPCLFGVLGLLEAGLHRGVVSVFCLS